MQTNVTIRAKLGRIFTCSLLTDQLFVELPLLNYWQTFIANLI